MLRYRAFLPATTLLWSLALGIAVPRHAEDSVGATASKSTQKRTAKDRQYFDRLCTQDQKFFEAQAFAESFLIADALGQWRPRGKGQAAVDLYLGTDSSQMSIWDQSWFDILRRNIQGALSIYDSAGLPSTRNLYIMCSEPDYMQDLCGVNGSPFAYTFTDTGFFHTNHYLVLCPKFYRTDHLYTALRKANNGTYDLTQVNPFMRSSGAIYYHESLHWVGLTSTFAYPVYDSPDGKLTGKPQIYKTAAVAEGAKTYNTAGMVHVSSAYTAAALSMFVQNFFNLTNPPGPSSPSPSHPPRRSRTRSTALTEPHLALDLPAPFNNATRPKDLPDPNTAGNEPGVPGLLLSAASDAWAPSQGSKGVVGTS